MMASQEIVVTIEDQGKMLGVLHLPEKRSYPCPLIIYCPGMNGERFEVHRLAVKFARYLAEKGIAFLRFDYYGMGLSDGYYFQMTNSTKVSNILCAFDYVQNHFPEIDLHKCVLLGFSDGARIALAAALEKKLQHVIFWSPVLKEFQTENDSAKYKTRFKLHPKYKKVMKPWIGLWVGIDYFKDLKHFNFEQMIHAYHGKSLQIYGSDDPLAEESKILLEEIFKQNQRTQEHDVYSVEQAGHLFTSVKLERHLMDITYSWLHDKLLEGE